MDLLSMKSFYKQLNDITFTNYFYELKLLALALFKWENLPNNMDEKWIEEFLFTSGECMFFNSFENGFMVAKTTKQGKNYYEEPIFLTPCANGLIDPKPYVVGEECVLIRNNDLSIPTQFKTQITAYRLTEITRTQDVNIKAQKTPTLIKCSERQKLTLKNIYEQYDGNKPVIFGSKDVETDGLQTLKTDAPIVFDKLEIQKHQVLNEYLTFLGINNSNRDKKERQITDEVQANNEEIQSFANAMLKARERACIEINCIFGTNIKVSKRIENWAVFEAQNENKSVSKGSEEGSEEGSEIEVA